ncbi:MAG: RNA polymerase sigma-70 factor [Cyclobacteriaceae bacterium]
MTLNQKVIPLKQLDDKRRWFEDCYDRTFTGLYQYAIGIMRDGQLAEDIVSDAFMNLWSNRDNLINIKNIDSYLFITVKNAAIRFVTRNPNHFSHCNLEEAVKEIDRHDPEQVMLEQELVKAIDDAINSLPDKCQIVYKLIRIDGKSIMEVANEMGISEGTVKNHMTKAISKIREEVADYLDDSDGANSGYGTFYILFLLGGMSLFS